MASASGFLGRRDWRLGLGTYRLGSKTEFSVKTALRIGYRHIDTAALYRNEDAVSSAISASGVPRREICVSTKICVQDIDRLAIREATEAALSRLGEIDVLMLHSWRPNAQEAWFLLNEELKAGRVRAIGVSNFNEEDIKSLPGVVPVINQIELSPFLQRRSLVEKCRLADIPIAAHSPLTKARKFCEIKQVMGECNPAKLLIGWGLSQACVVLPCSSNEAHICENYAALDYELTPEEEEVLNSLDAGFATHQKIIR